MCSAHAAVRSLLGEMVQHYERPIVVDMEAGLEHFSRATGRHVDTMLVVIEPYYKSMETGARMNELASELGVRRIHTVANKIRSEEDETLLQQFCRQRDLDLVAMIPEDEAVRQADRLGLAPLDHAASSNAVRRIEDLAGTLIGSA